MSFIKRQTTVKMRAAKFNKVLMMKCEWSSMLSATIYLTLFLCQALARSWRHSLVPNSSLYLQSFIELYHVSQLSE